MLGEFGLGITVFFSFSFPYLRASKKWWSRNQTITNSFFFFTDAEVIYDTDDTGIHAFLQWWIFTLSYSHRFFVLPTIHSNNSTLQVVSIQSDESSSGKSKLSYLLAIFNSCFYFPDSPTVKAITLDCRASSLNVTIDQSKLNQNITALVIPDCRPEDYSVVDHVTLVAPFEKCAYNLTGNEQIIEQVW